MFSLWYHKKFSLESETIFCFLDDVKMETDIDSGTAKIGGVDDVRISMDTFSANEKEEQK